MTDEMSDTPAAANRYLTRVLPADEWQKLGLPDESLPSDPENALVVIVQNSEGEVIGRWMAYSITILEGLEIDPRYQKRPTVASRLFTSMIRLLRYRGVTAASTLIQKTEIEELAKHVGFTQLPGSLWQIDLREPQPIVDQTSDQKEGKD